jgi:mRNA-degrading endonuclease YafQ of YafQ-DinJ toxin-antitoxin module
MLKPELSNRFKRDYNLLTQRGYDIAKLMLSRTGTHVDVYGQ